MVMSNQVAIKSVQFPAVIYDLAPKGTIPRQRDPDTKTLNASGAHQLRQLFQPGDRPPPASPALDLTGLSVVSFSPVGWPFFLRFGVPRITSQKTDAGSLACRTLRRGATIKGRDPGGGRVD